MNIIKFPGSKGPDGRDQEIEHASALKGRLVEFVLRGPMKQRHAEEMRIAGLDDPDVPEIIDFTDWFIFDWEDEDGSGVLDAFLASQKDLTEADRRVLERWYDPIDDLFEVVEVTEDGVTMRDAEGQTYFTVPTNTKATELGWRPKTVVETRILPVGGIYILSGIQSYYDGPGLGELTGNLDPLALARMSEDEINSLAHEIAGQMVDEAEIDDVRDLPDDECPPGSLAEAGRAFIAEQATKLKPDSLEKHALAVSLLVDFGKQEGEAGVEDLTPDVLLEFLTIWYPTISPDRTLGAARSLLSVTGKFTTWLDKTRKTDIGRAFKQNILPKLKDDLPRAMKASGEIMSIFPMFSIGAMLPDLARLDEDAEKGRQSEQAEEFEGIFRIEALEKNVATMRPYGSGAPDVSFPVEVPMRAAGLLARGDFIECAVLVRGGRAIMIGFSNVFCGAAPM